MNNFNLQSTYFYLVVLVLFLALFKTSTPATHSNSFKMFVIEIQEGPPYVLIDDAG